MCEKSIFCLFLASQSSALQQAHCSVSVWFDLMTSDGRKRHTFEIPLNKSNVLDVKSPYSNLNASRIAEWKCFD